MSIDKKANKYLPQDVQDAINTFITQFNIMEEYDLDTIPTEYTMNLLTTLSKYPEYVGVATELMTMILEDNEV
tara:strand:+ start:6522 stop:6740 length:219 start_codon:yes stop_codon:yes gene_type:complete